MILLARGLVPAFSFSFDRSLPCQFFARRNLRRSRRKIGQLFIFKRSKLPGRFTDMSPEKTRNLFRHGFAKSRPTCHSVTLDQFMLFYANVWYPPINSKLPITIQGALLESCNKY